jgi:hypothetical protein
MGDKMAEFVKAKANERLPIRMLFGPRPPRRYTIVDSAMLQEAAENLGVLHAAEANSPSSVKVSQLSVKNRMDAGFKTAVFSNTFVFKREWRNGRRAGLRIQCRKAWGFKSPLSHQPKSRQESVGDRNIRCHFGLVLRGTRQTRPQRT